MGKDKKNDDDIELKCPFCDGTEIIEASQGGYAQVTAVISPWYGCTVYHLICRDCGTIVRSFVKNPEKLVRYKNRRKKPKNVVYVYVDSSQMPMDGVEESTENTEEAGKENKGEE